MGKHRILPLAAVMASLLAPSYPSGKKLDPLGQWPQWRGPLSTGVAPHGDPPTRWSEEVNVRWKTRIPGVGQSTPIVWGDLIFLTSAVPVGEALSAPGPDADGAHHNTSPTRRQEFIVLAVDRRDGTIRWRKTVRTEQPHEGAHVTGSWASNSAVTDGELVFAFFGSRGLYALDMDGKVVWEVDLGDMQIFHGHGEGSSPALHGETLVVNWDHQGQSFLVALDRKTGAERWRTPRDEITSWSTPLVVEHGGKQQVIVSATKRVRGYDLADGKVLWEAAGLSRNVVASPVAGEGLVFAMNSYDHRAMLAIRLDGATGDITDTDSVVWTRDRDTPYVPSPLLYGDTLFFLKHNHPFLTGVDARTGAVRLGPRRLPEVQTVFASPVGASDRIYVTSRNGATVVLKRGGAFETLATNQLDDSFSASPAVVGGELFLRGEAHLYCIAEDPREGP